MLVWRQSDCVAVYSMLLFTFKKGSIASMICPQSRLCLLGISLCCIYMDFSICLAYYFFPFLICLRFTLLSLEVDFTVCIV